ncbi:hypothetical protein AVEN_121902-1 [Araneus ventricosus]|uniref:Uncharacterized protein n=1 Tax=Araneus ventricosus TaxID=182803 RepID=A0A4Y2VY13_ARAVE|nr:hypothetical protein AVEN_106083-1 [Araneus ventricosus]GBO29303.1 hypothetical protein AVEN_121902-1 [Araneus ventricosus]
MDLEALNKGQMTRTTPELAAPSPNFLTGLVARRLAPDVRFGVQQAHARWIFSGIGFRNWNPQDPEVGILPLGHRGPLSVHLKSP